MFFIDQTPILVEVNDDRTWTAFALTPNSSPRSRFLVKYLEKIGGVNESVPPGQYYFNMIYSGFTKITTLEPVPFSYKYR